MDVARRTGPSHPMLLTLLLIAIAAVVVFLAVSGRWPGSDASHKLGWMSPQWLAEYRASQFS